MMFAFFLIANKSWKVVGDFSCSYARIRRKSIRQKFGGVWRNSKCLFYIWSDDRHLTKNCWRFWRRQLHLTFFCEKTFWRVFCNQNNAISKEQWVIWKCSYKQRLVLTFFDVMFLYWAISGKNHIINYHECLYLR